MSRRRCSAEQIIGKLREGEVSLSHGETVAVVCRKLGIVEQTYYRWRKAYGGLKADQVKRFKALEKEDMCLNAAGGRPGCGHRNLQAGDKPKLVSPSKRRNMVLHVREQLGVSEYRACRVLS